MKTKQEIIPSNTLSIILIAAAVILVYTRSLWFNFCWDDMNYVLENRYIRGISWGNIKAIFTHQFEGNYAPVHVLTYLVEYALWGLDPRGYHLVNILLHIFNGLFLFILIKKITDRRDVALFASLLFALHPVQVENVAWVTEQKSLLAMAFFLPAFYCYIRDEDSTKGLFYWASVFLYGMSLLAKVSTISLPILLLLYDLSYRKTFEKRFLINKVPYIIIAACMSLASILIQTSNRGMFYFKNDPFITFFTTLVAVKVYLFNLVLPIHLSAYYSLVHTRLSEPMVLLSLLLTASLVFGAIYLFYRKEKQAGFWASWFWIAILPNLNIIPLSVVMADRYLYLPMIGPSVMLALVMFGPVKAWLLKHAPITTGWIYATAGVLVLLLAVTSHTRSRIWENNLTLWTDTVTRLQHGIPYANLGASYLELGRTEEAKKAFEKGIEVMPNYYLPYQNLGRIYLQENDLARAEHYFLKDLSLNPQNPFISKELANIYLARNDLDRAFGIVTEGLKYAPGEPSLLNLKAHVLTRKGELQEPREIYRGLTNLEPNEYANWFNYGAVLSRLGQPEEAENALKRAIAINGTLPNAYKELASLYERGGRNDQAAANFEQGLKAFQENGTAVRNLSYLYLEHFPAKADRIITIAQRSREHAPNDPNTLDILGWAYVKKGNYAKAAEYYKQALAVRPGNPYFLYQAGIVSIKAGQTKSGKAYLEELVKKYPDDELSKRAIKMAGVK